MSPPSAVVAPPSVSESVSTPACRLVALDLDGTLLDSQKQVSPANHEALRRAGRAGIELAVITGRRFAELEALTAPLPESVFRAGHGGALIRRGGRTIAEVPLPRAAASEAARVALETEVGRSLTLLISERDGSVRIAAQQRASERVARYLATARPAPEFQASPTFAEDPLHAVLAGPPEACREAEALLRETLGDSVNLERTEYRASGLGLLDVLSPEASKGAALARIASEIGAPLDATVAIGDNWNDLEMLRTAGRGIVMDNAEPGVKRIAQELGMEFTGSHDEDGVATALDALLARQ